MSHRLILAKAAKASGHEVKIATRVTEHGDFIRKEGIDVLPLLRLRRSSLNPLRELAALFELFALYRRERPAIVHQVAFKPVVYGTLAAHLAGVPAQVNALGGLGFVFSSRSPRARLLRPVLIAVLRVLLKKPQNILIVQNDNDYQLLTQNHVVDADRIRLISSAGVDMNLYYEKPMTGGAPLIVLASRMLWDKGIGDFVAASQIIRDAGIAARFVLVGAPDDENPTSIPRHQLEDWNKLGVIEWWGYRNDVPEIFSQARIVCLPSYYGEGIPKVLLEAMACARPIVTTDTPGCRELVRGDENGVLVPPQNPDALAHALMQLIKDPELCANMGKRGREIAASEYALPLIVSQTLAVYRELASC